MKKIKGIYAAGMSVFNDNLSLNIVKTVNHAESIIEHGCHGVAIFGSTGQAQLISVGEKISLLGGLEVIEYIPETGLQIKADPGIPLIYLGFGVLMISTLLSYLSYTQFWLAQIQDKLMIGGDTNRAKLNLKVTFLDLVLPYKKDL